MTYDITRLVFALDVVQSKRFPASDPPLSFRAEGVAPVEADPPRASSIHFWKPEAICLRDRIGALRQMQP